jgi:hypothetical protein
MSGDKLISILETDFKKAFTFEFDFNNESNELKLNEIPCPNGEFDQKSIEKYNDNVTKEINRQMGKLREVIKANEKSFNEKKIDEWANNKSSAFSKLKSIVLASVKKNNVVLFSNFCSHVPAQNLYDLIFNVNKLILSIVVSKLKMLVDSASTNEHLKHQIAENEKKIAELKKEHDTILKEHSGKATAEQQAEVDRLNMVIADNEKRMAELETEHERKIKDHNDNSEKLTTEQKNKQQEEIAKLEKTIADKEATIEKLHAEHKETVEGHAASASQLSDTQKKELEALKQTLEKLKAENKHLTELNIKRDKFEKDGINKLVNIIKTAQNLVDVNDTKKPLSNDGLGNSSDVQASSSNIPPPPPLNISDIALNTPQKSPQESPETNFLNELRSPGTKARLRKTRGPSLSPGLLNQIADSPIAKRHTRGEVLPHSNMKVADPSHYTSQDNERFKQLQGKKQRSPTEHIEQRSLIHKRNENNTLVNSHANDREWKESHPGWKVWESKYLKYKNKYLQLKKLHNL